MPGDRMADPRSSAPPTDDDADPHLVERRVGGTTLVSGGFLDVRRDDVLLPDGSQATREYIEHPGAVVVVPMLDDGRLVLVRQYRYPVAKVLLELPAGKLDAGEAPLACAMRELDEETGYTARRMGPWRRDPQRRGLFDREHRDLVRARPGRRSAAARRRRVRRDRAAERGRARRPRPAAAT